MPRWPATAERIQGRGTSVFERFLPRIRAREERPTKLHIGDAADPPVRGLALERDFTEAHPHWHQYPNTAGVGRLRRALADDHRARHALPTDVDQILVTAGATNALSATCTALLDPGDEVLVPTPSWPFFRGMVPLAHGVVREVPFYTSDVRHGGLERVEAAVGPKTAVLYLNTPNNPSGRVLDGPARRALLDLARRHDLWVISDEAYDGMSYDPAAPGPIECETDAGDRVIGVYTFSKIHRAAGLRLGWIRAAPSVRGAIESALVHLVYSASALSQELVLDAVRTRPEWEPGVREDLHARRDAFLAALDVPVESCEGTYFAFLDARPFLGRSRTMDELIGACLDAGVLIAPGSDFGTGYDGWIRMCFAGEPIDDVVAAAKRLRTALVA